MQIFKKMLCKKKIFLSAILLCGAFFLFCLFWLNRLNPKTTYFKPITDNILTLDPRKTRFRTDYVVAKAIYGQFLKLDEFGEVLPDLVESWSVNKTGDNYTFYIRKGVQFHSGKVATAKDVYFSIHFLAQPTSLVNQFFSDIQGYDEYGNGTRESISGVNIVNEFTISIDLKKPSFLFLYQLADFKIVVLPDNLNGIPEEDFFRNPDGIGPYKIDQFSEDHSTLKISVNESYFGSRPRITNYVFKTMEKSKAIEAFLKGEVHDLEVFFLTNQEKELVSKNNQVFSVGPFSISLMFLNGRKKIFRDTWVRKYFQSIFDTEMIREACQMNIVPESGIVPEGYVGAINYSKRIELTGTIGLKMKKQIQISTQKLIILIHGSDVPTCVTETIQENISKTLLIPVSIHWTPSDAIASELSKGNYDLFFEFLSIRGSEPFQLLSYFDQSSAHNLTYFSDPKISNLRQKIQTEPSKEGRSVLYKQLNQYISIEKAYVIPMYSDPRYYVFGNKVKSRSVPAIIMTSAGFGEIWF